MKAWLDWQESIIFSGSLRSNLDPFRRVLDDHVLEEALQRVGLQGRKKPLAVIGSTRAVAAALAKASSKILAWTW